MPKTHLKIIHTWYARNERLVSLISLIGGFVFNVFTLTRVDHFMEDFWVIMHLLVVAACIILINREENEGIPDETPSNKERLHFWLRTIMQFMFGGLLSTFIVFYLRSAVIAVAWPFFLVLAAAFIANESFKKHYSRISFQIGFLFLSLYLFMIFLVPVLTHQISTTIFLASGGISIILLIGFLTILRRFTKAGFGKTKHELLGVVIGIFVAVNGLYFLNFIPPLPLALTDAGIYHSVSRDANATYTVTHEPETWRDSILRYVSVYPAFHTTPNGLVYAYSAIFSPVSFSTTLTHVWQYYETDTKKWVTVSKTQLSVFGGREEGYRTYSISGGLEAGKWRVNVETPTGQLVGRMAFEVIVDAKPATLVPETKD